MLLPRWVGPLGNSLQHLDLFKPGQYGQEPLAPSGRLEPPLRLRSQHDAGAGVSGDGLRGLLADLEHP